MRGYTRDELFERLIDKTRELGHQATFEEVQQDAHMPDPNQYAFYYGSFTDAAREAFIRASRTKAKPKVKAKSEVKSKAKSKNRKEVKNMRKITEERLEEYRQKMQDYCDELGHVPNQVEIQADPDLPNWITANKYFGPWYKWNEVFGHPFGSKSTANAAASALKATTGIDVDPEELMKARPTKEEIQPPTPIEGATKEIPFKLTVPANYHGQLTITIDI